MKYLLCCLMLTCLNATTAQTVDSMAIKQVDSLILVSRDLTAKSDFELALEVNAAAEQLALEQLGPESAAYGKCCFNKGRILHVRGDFQKAEDWYVKARRIQEKALGKEHPDYAWSLNNLAALYQGLGRYKEAITLHLEARTIREKTLGREHGDYIKSLNNLAALYQGLGRLEEAVSLLLEAISIQERTIGRDNPDFAVSLLNLAMDYVIMGQYDKIEPLYLEARSIQEKALGPDHPHLAVCLNDMGAFYERLGQYEKAEPLYRQALSIKEHTWGKLHPQYAISLLQLANLYTGQDKYELAEPLYLEAKSIRGKVLGKEHPDYAQSLLNLANLYKDMGNYDKAEPLYLEAKDIWGKVRGNELSKYAVSLNNLANLYWYMDKKEKVEPLYLEAKDIREKVLGNEHPEYAQSLHNLGNLYKDMGNYDKAEPLYLEAKDIQEKVLGKRHPDYASSLNNLAILYWNLGQNEKVEPLYLEAKDIREKVLGKAHPDYTQSLHNLANLYESRTRYLEAEPFLEEALTLHQSRLVNATSFQSEQELAKYAVTFQASGDNLSTYIHARLAAEAEPGILPNLAYDHALFYKGFLLTAAARLNAPSMASPETVEINISLKGYRRRLAAEYTKPIAERKGIAELEEKANAVEKELARTVSGYAEALRQVKWQEVQAALPDSAMALEFVHFRINFPQKTDSIMYAALLLRPGTAQPLFIPLFEEKEFDHLLSADRERKADYVNELYNWADRSMVQLGRPKKSLNDLIWSKIEAVGLVGIKTVYYSSSGVLHRLNLGAITINDETILSDRYNLVALNSTRQLVIPSTIITQANDALLVGGVNFEVDSIHVLVQDEPLLSSRSAADARIESGTRGGTWSYLKWTEKEVANITTSLTTEGFNSAQLTGNAASEETIKAIGTEGASPRILHIATHGFFFPDPEVRNEVLGLGESEPVFKSSDNPMIRSGLILAGGNYAWQHGKTVSPDKEDGILTAYEISQMNLANTELVVLSACETGLGDIKGNEGVYGLQRAFKIAGAKYLIMSLWQVPDRETMEFMTTFYRNWLEENMTIPDAFRKTQREMRDRFFNPYSWAGFVLVE